MNYDSSKNTTIMSCSSKNPPSPVIDHQTDSKTTAASAKKNHFCRERPLQKKKQKPLKFYETPGRSDVISWVTLLFDKKKKSPPSTILRLSNRD